MKVWICCIAQNENFTIEDWVKYHLKQGIDKIFIFDNNDIDDNSLTELLENYIQIGKVIVDNSFKGMRSCQMQAYNFFIELMNKTDICDWCGFLDCDEYLTLNKEKFPTLSQYFEACPSNADCIYINWEAYTSNGQIFYENKPVVERFTEKYIHKDIEDKTNFHIKTFLKRGSKARFIYTPHNAINGKVVTSSFDVCNYSPWQEIDYKYIKIRHYVVKSLQEFMYRKLKSHCADRYQESPYTLDYFKKNNNDSDKNWDKIFNDLKQYL